MLSFDGIFVRKGFGQSDKKGGNHKKVGICELFYKIKCFCWWFYGGGVVDLGSQKV